MPKVVLRNALFYVVDHVGIGLTSAHTTSSYFQKQRKTKFFYKKLCKNFHVDVLQGGGSKRGEAGSQIFIYNRIKHTKNELRARRACYSLHLFARRGGGCN